MDQTHSEVLSNPIVSFMESTELGQLQAVYSANLQLPTNVS